MGSCSSRPVTGRGRYAVKKPAEKGGREPESEFSHRASALRVTRGDNEISNRNVVLNRHSWSDLLGRKSEQHVLSQIFGELNVPGT